jgi:hypothetical protein
LGVEFDRDGIPILLNSEELCVRIIVGKSGSKTVGKPILLAHGGESINKLEYLGPRQEVARLGVVKVATTLANMSLKTFY